MPAMMVYGAMMIGRIVDSACRQGATYSEGQAIHGDRPAFLTLNGVRATLFTCDRGVVVGADIVEYVENTLNIVIDNDEIP